MRSVTTSVTVKEEHSDVRTYTLRMQMYCVTMLPTRYAQSLGIWKLKSNNTKGAVKKLSRNSCEICTVRDTPDKERALGGVFRLEFATGKGNTVFPLVSFREIFRVKIKPIF